MQCKPTPTISIHASAKPIRFLSLFSGIEAASVAWRPLGWECVAVAEVEPFPCVVLKHHYPTVPNLGDVTRITEEHIKQLGRIDLVVGGFPCFPAGTLILTRRGLVPIEKVVNGEDVYTHAGRWRRVTSTMSRYASGTLTLKGGFHPGLVTTDEHPFWASEGRIRKFKPRRERRRGNWYETHYAAPEWVEAHRMQGRYWSSPVFGGDDEPPAIRPVPASSGQGVTSIAPELTEDLMWLVGAWVAEGWLRRRRDRGGNLSAAVICSAKNKTVFLADRIRRAGFQSSPVPDKSTDKHFITNRAFAEWLHLHFGEYSHGKRLPVWLLTCRALHRRAFLDGYLWGDGNPIKDGWRASTVSRELAFGVSLLAQSLGWATSIGHVQNKPTCVIEGRVCQQRPYFVVSGRLKKKQTSAFTIEKHIFTKCRTVTPSGAAEVFNISVEVDESYVADGVVVHNCQDLSAAGKRKGLTNADGTVTRSGLFFTGMQIFQWARQHCGARFLLIENVPGLYSSNKGRDFASVVEHMAGLDEIRVPAQGWGTEGVAVGDNGLLEWCCLDAQWAGLAQRRRRVFALLDTGDWANRPPILLEPEGLRGDPPPRRETGEKAAPTISARTQGGGGLGTDFDCGGGPIAYGIRAANTSSNGWGVSEELSHTLDQASPHFVAYGGNNTSGPVNVATALSAHGGPHGRLDFESETFVAHTAPCLRSGNVYNNSDPGMEAQMLVPVQPYTLAIRGRADGHRLEYRQDGTANAILTPSGGRAGIGIGATAFSCKDYGADAGETAPTLRAMGHADSHANAGGQVAVAFAQNTRDELRYIGGDGSVVGALAAQPGMKQQSYVQQAMAVRRITVTEAERLMGVPDGYTNVPYRGKPAADGPRYKCLGNSFAITVVRWIGYRIQLAISDQPTSKAQVNAE